jgi:hypothetical protein
LRSKSIHHEDYDNRELFTSLAYAALITLASINHRSEMQVFNAIQQSDNRTICLSLAANKSAEAQPGPLQKVFPQLPVFDRMKNFCLISLRAAAGELALVESRRGAFYSAHKVKTNKNSISSRRIAF